MFFILYGISSRMVFGAEKLARIYLKDYTNCTSKINLFFNYGDAVIDDNLYKIKNILYRMRRATLTEVA